MASWASKNLGGDPDRVKNNRFRFYALPIRRRLGDGSKVRFAAEMDERELVRKSLEENGALSQVTVGRSGHSARQMCCVPWKGSTRD